MTTPLRLILALIILMLLVILAWVAFFDGPRALTFSALGLCGALLLALFSSKWRSSRDGRSRH